MRGTVPLNRALSKLGVLSRSEATAAIRAGRIAVNGRIVTDIAHPVVPERTRFDLDGVRVRAGGWRTLILNKPRGTVTTRRDPEGRRTIWDVVGEAGQGLVAVGRLDLATSGLLILTSDTRLADWIAEPANEIPRVYVVTVRGRVTPEDLDRLLDGVAVGPAGTRDEPLLRAAAATLDKASGRESRVIIELREGRNRAVRRLCEAIGHDVTRLKRVSFGGLTLGELAPGTWRELSAEEIRAALPGAPISVRSAEV